MSKVDFYKLQNGMVLLGQRMDHVQSVSFQFLLPAGAATLPTGTCGAASVISNWIFRGAGDRNSRQLVEALDGLGIHRNTSVSSSHLAISASQEAGTLSDSLDLFADVILRPALAAEQFELSRQLTISELEGLDDDPRQKVMIHLNEQFYPDPFGQPAHGKLDQLQSLSFETVSNIASGMFNPSQTIFSICGNYDFDAVCNQMETLFGNQQSLPATEITAGNRGQSYLHIPTEGAQVHIGLMTQVPPISADCYYDLMAAVSVLSGSMSSRLFTEVREKRGLCYAVGARYRTMKEFAGISCYAGTTPDKAQQTLDVIIEQFNELKNGITDDEMQRAQVGLKTSLIMQCESTSARSVGMAGDWFLLGRVRPLEEIRDKIEALTAQTLTDALKQNPFDHYTVVTIGSKDVTL